jgi:hypothetical protein
LCTEKGNPFGGSSTFFGLGKIKSDDGLINNTNISRIRLMILNQLRPRNQNIKTLIGDIRQIIVTNFKKQ